MITRFTRFLFLCSLITVACAERRYDNVFFSSEKCKELGHESDFDVCAVIEFCTGTDSAPVYMDSYEDAQLDTNYKSNTGDMYYGSNDGMYSMDMEHDMYHGPGDYDTMYTDDMNLWGDFSDENEFASEVKEAQMETKEHTILDSSLTSAPNNAEYGWRIEGSTTCSFPGPVLRLHRGLNHGLFAKGDNGVSTNLHFHGLHVNSEGNGDDPRRSVEGTENFLIYGIDLPADKHHGGTYWYHSHLNGAAWDQVKGGAFGMIVVDENGNDIGTTDPKVLDFLENERILILDNSHSQYSFYANGLSKEKFDFIKDEWYRLRILAVNTGSHSSQETLNFEGCTVHALAHDGIFRFTVPEAESRTSFLLTSSSRLDVAIQCSHDSKIVMNGRNVATITMDYSAPASDVTPYESGVNSWQSSRLEYTKDLLHNNVDHWWEVDVGETYINDVQKGPLCDDMSSGFIRGQVDEWLLKGADTHPVHLHKYPMQVKNDGCGSGHDVGEFYDTIVTANSNSRDHCAVRVHLVDFAGPAYLHCHIFQHAEQGATGWINVMDADSEAAVQGFLSKPNCVGTCGDIKERPQCGEPDIDRKLLRQWKK